LSFWVWPGSRAWDRICLRCGLCCYEKHHTFVRRRGKNIFPAVSPRYYIALDEPCPHLDCEKKLCRIYPDRLRQCRDCGRLTIFHALFAGYLPARCGYVKKFRFGVK
jgi:uncharacterized cysteine cluster protein YcgN (CxxCxxCC family)